MSEKARERLLIVLDVLVFCAIVALNNSVTVPFCQQATVGLDRAALNVALFGEEYVWAGAPCIVASLALWLGAGIVSTLTCCPNGLIRPFLWVATGMVLLVVHTLLCWFFWPEACGEELQLKTV